jgi:Fe-S-cluster-containing dehydrogenase component
MYDAVSAAALVSANEKSFGIKAIPNYKFEEAEVIVSFGADFLGTWVSPVEYAAKYAKNRKLVNVEGAKMSRHIQVESHMSLTGSNADHRILVKPSEQGAAIAALYNAVASASNGKQIAAPAVNAKAAKAIANAAGQLVKSKGKGIVISGSNNTGEQELVNGINAMLGNINETVDFGSASLQRQGNEAELMGLITEMSSGAINALFVMGANPVFDSPKGAEFKAGMAKVELTISTNGLMDETTSACKYAAPTNHWLESWGDVNPKIGHYSLIQPTIAPLFNTRQSELSLLSWAGVAPVGDQPAHDSLKAGWQTEMFPKQKAFATFPAFWDATIHDGVFQDGSSAKAGAYASNVEAAATQITQPAKSEYEVGFFETVNMGAGDYANNPWLQEMADPVTRTVWTNTLAIPVKYTGGSDYSTFNNLKDGDTVEMEVAGKKYTCVVVRQFGQMEGTCAIALNYGRDAAGYCGTKVGTNVQPALAINANGLTQYFAPAKISTKTGEDKEFATVQYHHTMGVTSSQAGAKKDENVDEKMILFQGALVERSIIRRANLSELKSKVEKLVEERKEFQEGNKQTLYRGHQDKYKSGHHWGMHIDLNACIGCGACTVACMSENNVPVVGKHEVHRHHEMTWLRIDRYFYGDVENPSTVYQPMMCQHCDNAPCENVCPVNATNHSSEGINQMTYNRCIGTRYCANNCPYKVRRFNWQDYTTADIFPYNERDLRGSTLGYSGEMPYGADNLTRMVLNPDVTVRTRGVIEKCSMCMQRIQEGKLGAKKEGRQLRDGDIKTACQTACPTEAITFGDKNNPESIVSKKIESPLNYIVLEEVNTQSNITYSARITNRDDKFEA